MEMPTERIGHQAILLRGGRVLFGGGYLPEVTETGVLHTRPHPYLEIYDPSTYDWWRIPLPASGLADVKLSSMPDGKVLIVGTNQLFTVGNRSMPSGLPLETVPSTYRLFLFNPESTEFTELPATTIPRFSPQFVVMDDGGIMSIGGMRHFDTEQQSGYGISLDAEILEPGSVEWVREESPGFDFENVLNSENGNIFLQEAFPIPGGVAMALFADVGESSPVGAIAVYDAATDSWREPLEIDTLFGIPWRAMAGQDGRVQLVYGSRIESYDLETDEILIGYSGAELIKGGGLVHTADGRVLFAGGSVGDVLTTVSAEMSLYDPLNHAWVSAGTLPQARAGHSVTSLLDGSVLIHGGLINSPMAEQDPLPTNSPEVLSADMLSEINTRDVPFQRIPLPDLQARCWNLSDIESLPASSSDGDPPTESAEELLDMAFVTMDRLDSYATSTISHAYWYAFYAEEPGSELFCEYTDDLYKSAGNASSRSQSFDPTNPLYHSFFIIFDGDVFAYEMESETWRERVTEDYVLPQVPHRTLLRTHRGELDYIGVETLGGADVYHLQEKSSLAAGRTSYWIGVDDLLIRRIHYRQYREVTPEIEAEFEERGEEEVYSPRFNVLTEFHSFNEDFNIQPPPEGQMAQ